MLARRKFIRCHGAFWNGPAGILVSIECACVPAADGVNLVHFSIDATQEPYVQPTTYERGPEHVNGPWSEAEYRNKFANQKIDGKWYYDEHGGRHTIATLGFLQKHDYWIGPAGVRIPVRVSEVPALDGNQCYFSPPDLRGSCTEVYYPTVRTLSDAEYLECYAIEDEQGAFIWKDEIPSDSSLSGIPIPTEEGTLLFGVEPARDEALRSEADEEIAMATEIIDGLFA